MSELLDIDLLKACLVKDTYMSVRHMINKKSLCFETNDLLDSIGEYFEINHDIENVNLSAFKTWYLKFKNTSANVTMYDAIFSKLEDTSDLDIEQLNAQIAKYDLDTKMQDLAERHANYSDYDSVLHDYASKHIVDKTKDAIIDKVNLDLIEEQFNREDGYTWPMPFLDYALGTLVKGMFGVIAGRPNSSKTSFLAATVAHILAQNKPNTKVLWFNNEGLNSVIMSRVYTAILQTPWLDIIKDKDRYSKELVDKNAERCILVSAHSQNARFVTEMIEKHQPTLIIIDMLDHIQGFKQKGNEVSDAALERLYHWALTLACKYAPVIGTSQIPEITNQNMKKERIDELHMWPPLSALKGSQTAKQGAASFILMMGQDGEPNSQYRYFSAPKNKYGTEDFRLKVEIDLKKCVYTEAR